MSQLLTYADLSSKTGVAEGTLRQWKRRGMLPAPTAKFGASPVWDPQTVESWLDESPLSPALAR